MLPLSQTVPLDEKMDLHKFTLCRKNAKLKSKSRAESFGKPKNTGCK